MKKILILFITILIILFNSCLDDETVLQQKIFFEPDSIIINVKGANLNFTKFQLLEVERGQRLVLDPRIVGANKPNLKFEWKISDRVIGTEKKLDWEVDIFEDKGCTLNISEEGYESQKIYDFKLTLRNPYEEGFHIIAEKDGQMVMDWVEKYSHLAYTSNGISYEKVDFVFREKSFEFMNEAKIPVSKYSKLQFFDAAGSRDFKGYYLLLSENPDNCVNMKADNLILLHNLKDEFLGSTFPSDFQPVDAMNLNWMTYILNKDGKLYARKNFKHKEDFTGLYSPKPVSVDNKVLNISHMASANNWINSEIGLMWDKEQHRYISIYCVNPWGDDPANSGKMFYLAIDQTEGFTPFDEMQDMELIKMLPYGGSSGNNSNIWALYKNINGSYIIQKFKIRSQSGNIVAQAIEQIPVNFDNILNENSVFLIPNYTRASSEMLIASDDKLYFYDFDINTAPKLIKTFEGDKISHLSSGFGYSWFVHPHPLITKGKHLSIGFENGKYKLFKYSTNLNIDNPVDSLCFEKKYDKIHVLGYR